MTSLVSAPVTDHHATTVTARGLCGIPSDHPLPSRRQRLEAGRALEALAHAVEYLEDTTPFGPEPTPRAIAADDAIALLKQLNRQLFEHIRQARHVSRAQRRGLLGLFGNRHAILVTSSAAGSRC